MEQTDLDLEIVASVRAGLEKVQGRVASAAERTGRSIDDIVVVAVTKYASLEQVRALISLGCIDLGESRVQQIQDRVPLIEAWYKRYAGEAAEALRWHMIGHLQRNKIKQVAPITCLVHSVDTLRLAEELHNWAVRQDRVVDILLQVNVTGEESKHGLPPASLSHVSKIVLDYAGLRLRGLMSMAPKALSGEDARPVFARCRELFEDLRHKVDDDSFNVLSMGMSSDYEAAILEGANVIRVGSAIFGE